MLKAKATINHGGVVISGLGEDLEELHHALTALLEKRDGLPNGEVPPSGANLRIAKLCQYIRHADPVAALAVPRAVTPVSPPRTPGEPAGKILSFASGKELPFDLSLEEEGAINDTLDDAENLEELEEFVSSNGFDEDYIDSGVLDEAYDESEDSAAAVGMTDAERTLPAALAEQLDMGKQTGLPLQDNFEFRMLWPQLIFACLVLQSYLGSRYELGYSKKLKGLDWTLDWVSVRRFQIIVLDCLCQNISPAQSKAIRGMFMDSLTSLDGYCTQYVDKLSYAFARKNAAQRLHLLPQLTKKIIVKSRDYWLLEAEIQSAARKSGRPTWELSLSEEAPNPIEW